MLCAISASRQNGQPMKPAGTPSLASIDSKFVENKGQWDPNAKFMARMKGLNLWVTNNGLVYDWVSAPDDKTFHQPVFVDFVGATGKGKAEGIDAQPGHMNYFLGKRKAAGVRGFASATVKDLYPGIDLITYFDKLEKGPRYDLVVHPGADPNQVRMRYRNAKNLHVDKDGALIYGLKGGEVAERRQMAYQKGDKGVDFHFFPLQHINKDGTVSFDTTGYRKDRTLVIDPLVWSNLIGGDGTSDSGVTQVAPDALGNLFVAGGGASSAFTGISALGGQTSNGIEGGVDSFLAKFEPDGTLDWFTEFGGSAIDFPTSVVVDSLGFPTVAGLTTSSDFFQTGGSTPSAGYIARFDPSSGSVTYSEFLNPTLGTAPPLVAATPSGGVVLIATTQPNTLALFHYLADGTADFGSSFGLPATNYAAPVVDSQGHVYIEFATTAPISVPLSNAEDLGLGSNDVIVIGLDSTLTTVGAVSSIGAVGQELAAGLCVDGNDNIFAAANVSPNANGHMSLPATGGGWQSSSTGVAGGYVVKFASDFSSVTNASSFADPTGNPVQINGLSVDANGNVLFSEAGYRSLPLSYDYYSGHATPQGVVKLSSTLSSIAYASYFGGDGPTSITSVVTDISNRIYVAGSTSDPNFTVASSASTTTYPGRVGTGTIGFVSVIDPSFTQGLTRITSDRGANPAFAGGVGKTVTVSVYFIQAPGTTLSLISTNPILQVDGGNTGNHNVAAGERVAKFTLTANDVAIPTDVILIAVGGGTSAQFKVTVEPFVRLLVARPTSATAGSTLTAYVYPFEQPATSQTVTFSGDVAGAIPGGQICIIAGLDAHKTSGPTVAAVNLGSVPTATTVNLTATAATGSSASAAFTLKPIQIQTMAFAYSFIPMGERQLLNMTLSGSVPVDTTVVVSPTNKQLGKDLNVFFAAGTSTSSQTFNSGEIIGVEGTKVIQYSATLGGQRTSASFQVLTSGFTFSADRTDVGEGNSFSVIANTNQYLLRPETLAVSSTSPASIAGFNMPTTDPLFNSTPVATTFAGLTSNKVVRLDSGFVAADGTTFKPVHSVSVTVHPELTSITLASSSVKGGAFAVGTFNLFEPCTSSMMGTVSSNSPLVALSPFGDSSITLAMNTGFTTVPFALFTKPVTRNTPVLLTFTSPLGYKTRSLSLMLTP